MQDVAIVEELPEIRDSIEFCENMVDTLQEELNGLRGISFLFISSDTSGGRDIFAGTLFFCLIKISRYYRCGETNLNLRN